MSSLALLWGCLASRNFDGYVVMSVVNVVTGLVNSVFVLTSLALNTLVLSEPMSRSGWVSCIACSASQAAALARAG